MSIFDKDIASKKLNNELPLVFDEGWTPVPAIEFDGANVVLKTVNYIRKSDDVNPSTKPTIVTNRNYWGYSGYTDMINAVKIPLTYGVVIDESVSTFDPLYVPLTSPYTVYAEDTKEIHIWNGTSWSNAGSITPDVSDKAIKALGNIDELLIDDGDGNPKDSGVKISTDNTLGTNTDTLLPTEKAVKYYIDNLFSNLQHSDLPDKGTYIHDDIDNHIDDTSNPHDVTIEQIAPTTTKGDIMVYDGASVITLPYGSDGQILTTKTTEPSGLKWETPTSTSELYVRRDLLPGTPTVKYKEITNGTPANIVETVTYPAYKVESSDGLIILALPNPIDINKDVRIMVYVTEDSLAGKVRLDGNNRKIHNIQTGVAAILPVLEVGLNIIQIEVSEENEVGYLLYNIKDVVNTISDYNSAVVPTSQAVQLLVEGKTSTVLNIDNTDFIGTITFYKYTNGLVMVEGSLAPKGVVSIATTTNVGIIPEAYRPVNDAYVPIVINESTVANASIAYLLLFNNTSESILRNPDKAITNPAVIKINTSYRGSL